MKRTLALTCAFVILGLTIGAAAAAQNKREAGIARRAASPAANKLSAGAQNPSPVAATQEQPGATLPVERVVLYRSGVGYFEHEGRVHGNQSVGIDFTSGQLNDVLSSLTVLDLGGGRVAGVSYNSEAPLSQRLGALRLPLAEDTDVSQFYSALRGARLEIRSGNSTITGRLLSVEQKTRVIGNGSEQVAVATVVSDSGEVRSVEITPAVAVRLADRDVSGEVQSYLSLLASERQADLRRMTIQTQGTGDRALYVSYISEVPIWKTTYRIVLPSKSGEDPLLQGWAIVDNTVGEDWNNVQLSLVAGAPQSFIQQLSQPYYSRRPVIPLPQTAQPTPQTHESAMEGGVGAADQTARVETDVANQKILAPEVLPRKTLGAGGNEAAAYGVAGGTGVPGWAISGIGPPPAPLSIEEARQKMEAAASGIELGDFFEYKLKDRVTIRKNESALVPIVQAHVKAEKVSLWNPSLGSNRPLRAVWLTNTSGLTLDGGSISVLDDETFAGEGLIDSIKPGERRLISYASDLGVRVDISSQSTAEPVTRVSIAHGTMLQTREMREEATYKVRDDDTSPRTVVMEHPLRAGWVLASDAPKPEETTSSAYRFELSVEPKTTQTLDVREAKLVSTTFALTNINSDLLALFVRQKSINPEIQAALEKIVAQKNKVASLQDEIHKRESERQQIFNDQQRLRENLKVLKGTPEEKALTQRYVQQLDDEETRLAGLRKESADYTAQRDKAQADLNDMIESVSFDTTL
ncbi:MAG: hypothetical protein KGL02_01305 [Acidobacteriota bacterium]|nr:hypothetical protein [Acidobacteriota bacterium]